MADAPAVGPEMDARVAEAMGHNLTVTTDGRTLALYGSIYALPKPYSTNIAAAWAATEWLRANYDTVYVAWDAREGEWQVECCEHIDYESGARDDGSEPRLGAVVGQGATAQLAICNAVLQVVDRAREEGRNTLAMFRHDSKETE